ncbi:MAG: hypothetical protein KF878_20715 [Planctomycetes bacterium]|nr:hypothetical protein [Planctomycetota bacterium]
MLEGLADEHLDGVAAPHDGLDVDALGAEPVRPGLERVRGRELPLSRAVEDDARRSYGVRVVKRLPELQERFYAITIERKVKHPAAVAMTRTAKAELFAPGR